MNLASKLAVAALIAGATVAAVPGLSFAATYAYVNASGEVRTTEASTPDQAIMTAPGIDNHSGVLLVNDATDTQVVGDSVSGV